MNFSHGFSFQIDFVGVVNQAVQSSIGQGWITDMFDPGFNRDLGGNDGKGSARTCFKVLFKRLGLLVVVCFDRPSLWIVNRVP